MPVDPPLEATATTADDSCLARGIPVLVRPRPVSAGPLVSDSETEGARVTRLPA